LLILSLSTVFTSAQVLIPDTIVKATKTVFKTARASPFGTQTNGIIVANINNKYYHQTPKVFIDPGVLYSKI
jgi:hypothetical protein